MRKTASIILSLLLFLAVSCATKNSKPVTKTAEGIHVGMKISDAAKILGKATITLYSSLDGSPEFVTFKNFKNKSIRFRVKSRTQSEAGKYMQSEGGIISSEEIYPDSYISAIIIDKK